MLVHMTLVVLTAKELSLAIHMTFIFIKRLPCDFVIEIIVKVVTSQDDIIGNISFVNFSDIALEYVLVFKIRITYYLLYSYIYNHFPHFFIVIIMIFTTCC